jgi:hypothetical protein
MLPPNRSRSTALLVFCVHNARTAAALPRCSQSLHARSSPFRAPGLSGAGNAGVQVRAFRAKKDVECLASMDCPGLLRPRVMFYADEDEDLITQSFEGLLEEDLKTADLVLWVSSPLR